MKKSCLKSGKSAPEKKKISKGASNAVMFMVESLQFGRKGKQATEIRKS
jgi:hypothetical protein